MTDLPDYEFGFVWDFEAYKQIKEKYVGKKDTQWQLRFGENGEYGAWEWTGDCFIAPVGGSTGAARTGRIVCYPETDVVSPANWSRFVVSVMRLTLRRFSRWHMTTASSRTSTP